MPHEQEWLDREPPAVDIAALDPRTSKVQCNAMVDDSHKYTYVTSSGGTYAVLTKAGREVWRVTFHEGPLAGAAAGDVNGVMIENLLAICADRLATHQRGKFACDENAAALTCIKTSIEWLKSRTAKRDV
jgi:hypothetical protein